MFPLLVFPYASKVLLPTNYGKYDFAISFVSYFAVCANLGVQNYAIKELIKSKIKSREDVKKNFSEIFIITLISTILITIIYIISIYNLEILKKEKKLFLIAGIQIYTAFMTIDYFFIAYERHKRRAIRIMLIKIISLICMFSFIKVPEDYIKFILIILLPQVLLKTIDVYSVKNEFIFRDLNLKRHMKSIFLLFIYMFTTIVYMNFDITLIGLILGSEQVGLYSIGLKLIRISIPIITTFGLVLGPKIIEKIEKRNTKELIEICNIYYDFLFLFLIPTCFILFNFSKEIILLLVGKNYLESANLIKIMVPVIIILSLNEFVTTKLLIPNKKEKEIVCSSILGICISVVLNLFFIKIFKLKGVAVVMIISEISVFLFRYFILKSIYKEHLILSKSRLKYILLLITLFVFDMLLKYAFEYIKIKYLFIIKILILIFLYIVGLIFIKDKYVIKIIEKIKQKR